MTGERGQIVFSNVSDEDLSIVSGDDRAKSQCHVHCISDNNIYSNN